MDRLRSRDSIKPVLVCFSHLRWDFVYQRPQHLMSRFARTHHVLFVEEPVFERGAVPGLRVSDRAGDVEVIVPVMPDDADDRSVVALQRQLLAGLLAGSDPVTFWFQSPMAFPIAPLEYAGTVIYDCMDELGNFQGAPPALAFNEKQLLARADIVFTGGRALFEAKRSKHPQVHCIPSGIDVAHFARARNPGVPASSPVERRRPVIGFAGVIDERMDIGLLARLASDRADLDFVLVGPIVKIDPASMPRGGNIRYAGLQEYSALPDLMREWDVAMMPFALNDATRYISPTKTPEYLAAGLPVVSTPIEDVVRRYGAAGLVRIARTADEFERAIDDALGTKDEPVRLAAVDAVLATQSWDAIWTSMAALERQATAVGRRATTAAGIS